MNCTHLIPAARDALGACHSDGHSVITVSVDVSHSPRTGYDCQSVTVRHSDGARGQCDVTGTAFAGMLDAMRADHAADGGVLGPLTLRLAPEPGNRQPAPLDARTSLFILSIHAAAASRRPGLTAVEALQLADLAYETNDAARNGTLYGSGSRTAIEEAAASHGLPAVQEATASFLRHTARLALHTMLRGTRPYPVAVELPAGHFMNTPAWLSHAATTRYGDGASCTDISYVTPALGAVLTALATLETPAAGDTLVLDLTSTPLDTASPSGAATRVGEPVPGVSLSWHQSGPVTQAFAGDWPNPLFALRPSFHRGEGVTLTTELPARLPQHGTFTTNDQAKEAAQRVLSTFITRITRPHEETDPARTGPRK